MNGSISKNRPVSDLHKELAMLRERVAELEKRDAERVAALDALRASEEKYRILLDESSDPIFTFFPDGRYRYVNLAFAHGVGKPIDQIVGRSIWEVFPKEEADKRFATIRWVFENGESRVIEVRVPRADGDRYYITTAKPILDDQRRVISVICISKDITDRKLLEERLSHMAQYDALTDLPNRVLFEDRLRHGIAQARREKTHLALMSLDLDRFKQINDTFGHHIGDLILQVAAIRMQGCMRESDTVGRLGGDEFAVLLPEVKDAQDALVVAEKLCHSINQPFKLAGCEELNSSASVGIAIYPDHGGDEVRLMRHADRAMYAAKTSGRDRVHLFVPGSD